MEQQEYAQRGYLREDFRLFHLKGAMEEQLDWHYHTFHKLIFFLGGQSGYGVEGRSYPLEPGDVILVPQGCVHRPEAAPGAPYERVILYLSPDYLARAGTAECPLDSCFTLATARFRFVLRLRTAGLRAGAAGKVPSDAAAHTPAPRDGRTAAGRGEPCVR